MSLLTSFIKSVNLSGSDSSHSQVVVKRLCHQLQPLAVFNMQTISSLV